MVESHPDNVLSDLRLDRPFPALRDYMEAVDLDSMDKGQHSHTPYVVLLYKFLQKWRETHGTERPKIYKEKVAFKELLRSGASYTSFGFDYESIWLMYRRGGLRLMPTHAKASAYNKLMRNKTAPLEWLLRFHHGEGSGVISVEANSYITYIASPHSWCTQ